MSEREVVRMLFGSHVYGTALPTSDLDYKAVFIPSREDLLLQRATKVSRSRSTGPADAKNAPGDLDVEEFSLHGYLKLLCEGQTVAIDMLFVPEEHWQSEPHEIWHELRRQRHELLSSGSAAFAGYCRTQANKYGVKGSRMAAAKSVVALLEQWPQHERLRDHWSEIEAWSAPMEHVEIVEKRHPQNQESLVRHLSVCGRMAPETLKVAGALVMYDSLWQRYGERARAAMNSEGIDWKALMHAVRVLHQAEELLATGEVTFPRPEAAHLLEIRQGRLPYAIVAEEIELGLERLPNLTEKSCLRAQPDRKLADRLIVEAYEEQIHSGP